jgi:molecular chaperone DnaJ
MLSGGVAEFTIPPRTLPGSQFRIKNSGVPDFTGKNRGDLVVQVKLDLPTAMSEEYKGVMKQLIQLEKDNITPQREKYRKYFDAQGAK